MQERIWSPHGPKGLTARSVLLLLLWHADAQGRVWLGIQAIADKTGAGNLRTVRNALDSLVRQGWLQSSAQTWASLTLEQSAAGRPLPRRGDTGQAPNLYVVLGGRGQPVATGPTSKPAASRPGLARGASLDLKADAHEAPSPFRQGGPGQNDPREPQADLLPDPDPEGSRSKIESVERASRVATNTHLVSKDDSKNQRWGRTWNLIVEAHTEKTTLMYGLAPLAPDIKREQQKALAECLEGAAADVQAKLHARTGSERDVHDVQRELATRVMQLYFKRDNEHLRRVKHALRDLPREFHARITEAMQMLLRESHDNQVPRQTKPESKIVETTEPKIAAAPVASAATAQALTAREARRLLEVLGTAQPPETPSQQAFPERTWRQRPKLVADDVNLDRSEQLSHQDKPTVPDKPVLETAPPSAPNWSVIGPWPVKVQTSSDLQQTVVFT